jgi:hypothetical protein
MERIFARRRQGSSDTFCIAKSICEEADAAWHPALVNETSINPLVKR